MDANSQQRIATKELRGAVNVADAQSEPDTIRNAVEGGIDEAQGRIGTLQSISDHDGRFRSLGALDKSRKIRHTKLTVSIGIGEIGVPRRRKARAQRATVSAIYLVPYQTNEPAMSFYEATGHAGGIVARAVVDKNDLIGSCEGWKCDKCIGNQCIKVIGLVMTREEEGELWQWHLPLPPSRLHSADDFSDDP